MASADILPSSSSATSTRRTNRTGDTTETEVSSEDDVGENRNRIRKKRSICHAMSSTLMIAKNRNRSSSVESLEAEMELSPSRRRRIRPRPNSSSLPLLTKEAKQAEVDEKGPHSGYSTCSSLTEFYLSDSDPASTSNSSERNRRKSCKRLHNEAFSSSSEPSCRRKKKEKVSPQSGQHGNNIPAAGSSKSVLCHHAEPTQSFTIKSNAPHLMSYETKQVISFVKCKACGEFTKSTHTELNVNLQTAQQQPIVNYVPIPVAVSLPLQHMYPQPVLVRESVQQSEEELGNGERMLMAALRRKVTPR